MPAPITSNSRRGGISGSRQYGLRSPFLPTPGELLFFLLYPLTLVLGSLFSLLNPTARVSSTTYNPTTQSHTPPLPSYFASKRNVFNTFFVKIGWFWMTIAFVVFLFPTAVLTPRRLQGLLRWTLVTTWWVAVTRWFFGPGIMDRVFSLTGGFCQMGDSRVATIAKGALCKASGGKWHGGHDASGHVFLLVLGSGFLLMELIYEVLQSGALLGGRDERTIISKRRDGGLVVISVEEEKLQMNKVLAGETSQPDLQESAIGPSALGVRVVLLIAVLAWWMLLMTASYFHTWFEKVTGLILALSGIFAVHYLPRGIPLLRELIGMPGI